MNKSILKKGNGEFLGFAIVSVFIAFLIIFLTAFIQHFYALTDMSKAISVVARSAAVCMSMDDAREQAQTVAESAITNPNIDNITVDVNYAGDSSDWISGAYLTVSLKADVHTIDPYVTSGPREKTMLVTVENLDAGGRVINLPEGVGGSTTYTNYVHFHWIDDSARVYNAWVARGCQSDHHVATIDGYYLIACTETFGVVGDRVTFVFADNTRAECIIADIKNQRDDNCNMYGHENGRNVIEFEAIGNPGTSNVTNGNNLIPEWRQEIRQCINHGHYV